jgi:TrmH family RNA methyltransferase
MYLRPKFSIMFLPISKNIQQAVRRLEMRKYRRQEGQFIAEGNKLVEDNLRAMKCRRLVAEEAWWAAHPEAEQWAEVCHRVTADEMQRTSLLTSPQEVLGVFDIPRYTLRPEALKDRLTLVLDDVQDPGNVGTIIRLADWFGLTDIVCSPATADCFAPKVVQASMGAIARVRVHYTELAPFLEAMQGTAVYGTYLEGENIYQTTLSPTGLILMGNEGRGISPALARYVTRRLNIPSFATGPASESLNVGVATAIIASEFQRRTL